jgi:hypothetical protein
MRMKGLKEKNKIRNTNQRKKRMYLTLVPVWHTSFILLTNWYLGNSLRWVVRLTTPFHCTGYTAMYGYETWIWEGRGPTVLWRNNPSFIKWDWGRRSQSQKRDLNLRLPDYEVLLHYDSQQYDSRHRNVTTKWSEATWCHVVKTSLRPSWMWH